MKKKVHVQVPMTYHSTLCIKPDCYGICHDHCYLSFSLDPASLSDCSSMKQTWKGAVCTVCGHPSNVHRHYNSLWKLQEEDEKVINEESQKKYLDAKSEKDKTEHAMQSMQEGINQLTAQIEEATNDVGRLAQSYAKLSLSGSFASQVHKSIKLIEVDIEKLKNDGSSLEMVATLESSLDSMKKKLNVLDAAQKRSKNSGTNSWSWGWRTSSQAKESPAI